MDSASTASSSPSSASSSSFVQKYKLRSAKVKLNKKSLKSAGLATKAALRAGRFKMKESSRDLWSKTRGPLEAGRRKSRELVDSTSDLLASLSLKVHTKIHNLSSSQTNLNFNLKRNELDHCDDDEESSEENFWGSDFSYSSGNEDDGDVVGEGGECHESDLDEDDVQEYELNGNNENRSGKLMMNDELTERMSWKQVVNEKVGIGWRVGKQLTEGEGKEAENEPNVYHVEQVETSGNHHEKRHSSSSSPSSSRNSITSTSTCSSSTPTLIKYRKLSQRPKDQPPPPPPPPPLPKSQPPILQNTGGGKNHHHDDDYDYEEIRRRKDDGIHLDGESGTKCSMKSRQVDKDKDFKSQQERIEVNNSMNGDGKMNGKVSNSDSSDHVKDSQQEVPVNGPNVWFRPDLTRAAAEQHLLSNNLPDGSFVIRPGASSHTFPHSLSLLFDGRVYHLNIRKVIGNHEESCPSSGSSRELFSLGKGTTVTPGRCFETLEELVQFYANKPLLLVSTRNKQQEISQGSDRRKQVKLLLL